MNQIITDFYSGSIGSPWASGDGSRQPPKDIYLYIGSPEFLAMHPVSQVAGIAGDVDGYLFPTAAGKAGMLTEKPLSQPDAYRIVQRRAKAAGIRKHP